MDLPTLGFETGLRPAAGGRPAAAVAAAASGDEARMRAAAREFESLFAAEMLKHAGLTEVGSTFGGASFAGGHGEEAFRSFLTREYAETLTENGAFGLADKIYAALKARADAAGAAAGTTA